MLKNVDTKKCRHKKMPTQKNVDTKKCRYKKISTQKDVDTQNVDTKY